MRMPQMLLITLLAIVGAVQALPLEQEGRLFPRPPIRRCPIKGQMWSWCKGCDGTCMNPNPPCPFICEPGCSCPRFASVVHKGRCIPPRHCPSSSKCEIEGQEFSRCKGCDGTCWNPFPICPLNCEPGCSCVDDTVVHEGKCIPLNECPECPIEGQTYKECKGCDGTCQDPNPICPLICEPGCSCDNNTVVHEGKCIPVDECPGCKIEGQEFSECKGCDGTCSDSSPICPLICEPGCSCVNDTVVHGGKCIPLDECPECPIEGQTYKECKGCDGTCQDPNPICSSICAPGCSCDNNTVVNEGKCIPVDECPACPIGGQEYSECKGCDGTCEEPFVACLAVCEPGCSCPSDTVVHEGLCIPLEDCPPLEGTN